MIALSVLMSTTIAVMPFKDLSGGKGQVGEAIRETVTSDLKEAGLQVVERGNIDKVIAEQNLQAKKNDLGMAESIRVGTLLGATLIVAGAYQKAASQVRLTARFVDVATGEVKGSAKVDGAVADILTLQDRITTELCKSAGLGKEKQQLFAKRPRPKVKSYHAIELYGDAVTQTDEHKKAELLKLSLNEDPQFVYAARDLDALEQRMKGYSAAAAQRQLEAEREVKAKLLTEKDPLKLYLYYQQLLSQLMMQRRYHHLLNEARAILANPPPPAPNTGGFQLPEIAAYYIVQAYKMYNDYDGVLREGEKFLVKYPTSSYFSAVQMEMNAAIETKRQISEGVDKAKAEIAKLPPDQQRDPCRLGPILNSHKQFKQARVELERCVGSPAEAKMGMPHMATYLLVWNCQSSGDYQSMYRYINELKAKSPEQYRNVKHLETMMPVD